MVYYSLQNKITKKLVKVYSRNYYEIIYHTFSNIGDIPWLVPKEDAKRALKTPNYKSIIDGQLENIADYDNPCNWLKISEWEVVEVTISIKKQADKKCITGV